VTETPPVQDALDELRRELRGEAIDFPDLVIRGARDKAAELRRDRPEPSPKLKRLAELIRRRELDVGDPELADEVKRSWVNARTIGS
jgi:hypothetical protein